MDTPVWVPAPGEVAELTIANGGLTNSFISCTAPYYEPFYTAKICNDYSGSFLNPYFGDHGAILFFGGGHAATNDNSVIALVLGAEGGTFRRMTQPTPIFGADTSEATRTANSTRSDASIIEQVTGEYLLDGQPASPHSYGSGDVIGPSEGGALFGSFVRVISGALGVAGQLSAIAAHQLDFDDLDGFADGPNPSYAWRRLAHQPGSTNSIQPNHWTAWVPTQRRIYYEARALGQSWSPRWFDLTTHSYVVGVGRARENDSDGSDNGTMFFVPERSLLVHLSRRNGVLRLQAMDVSQTEPSWDPDVVLDQTISIGAGWSCACWCPHNQRIIVGGAAGDDGAVWEVEIPQALSEPWKADRAPFAAGQSIAFFESGTYKKWSYNENIRAIVYVPVVDPTGLTDRAYVYRPRNT